MKNQLLNKKRLVQLFGLCTFLVLFANSAFAQDTFTWTGASSNNWTTAANWSKSGSAGTDTYPGQTRSQDLAVISNGGTPTLASPTALTVARLTINNATGPITGSTLTINSGATLTVSSASITNVVLAGGNIINNGTFAITTTSTAASLSGITCNTPSVLPSSATEFGYSGTGILTINIGAGTNANSAAIFVQAVNANTTYRMNVTRANTTFTLATAATSFAFRTLGGANASPLIIGGTGVALGTSGSRVRGGLLNVGGQSSVTIDASVTLEMNSLAANTSNGIILANGASAATTTFTNNGTINILGDTTVGGIEVGIGQFSGAALTNSNISAINNGTINVDIVGSTATTSAAIRARDGAHINITSVVTFTNNGTLTLKNSAFGTTLGYAILGGSAGQRTNTTFVNNGTANFLGTIANVGQGYTIVNNSGATINANTTIASFPAVTNNAGATFNFTKSPAVFTVLSAAAATAGAVYTDGSSNTYTVTTTKVTTVGTQMLTEVDPITAIPATGTLTRVSGTGDASIAYTVVTTQASALPSATTNSGTINTGASSRLGTIAGVTAASTGVIDPGGASRKGIIDFATGSNLALNATLRMQLDPGAVAGQHFDRITNSTAGGGFTITNAILNVTGIYTPAVDTTIDIITTNATGSLTGTAFASVTGLTTRWAVVVTTGTAGKVSLVYTAPVGIISAQSGPWSDTATWAGGVVPDATSPSVIVLIGHTVTADTAITRDAGTTTTIDVGATLATNLTYANNGTTTINGTFRINQGGFGSGSGTWTYGSASNLVFNHTSGTYGPIDASHTYWPVTGPVNVTVANSFTAPNGISLGVARTVNGIFQTAGGVTNANNLTVNGSLQLNAGGFVSGSPTYGSSSTLIYNSTTYGRGDEWTTALSGAGYPNNVQIGNGVNTTLNLVNGSVAYRRAAGNLVVSTGSTLLISGLTTGAGTVGIEFLGNINNDGTITLNGGTTGRLKCATMNNGFTITNGTSPAIVNLSNAIGGDLELTGNYNDNATFTASQRAVFFTGGSAQTIGGNAPGTFNIDYLVLNKTTTALVTLLRNIVVGAPSGGVGMTLTDGALDRLELNGFTLTLGTALTACTVSGTGLIRSTTAAPGSLVINGTGAMGTLNFGSGNNTLVNLTIDRTAGTGTAGVTFGSPAIVTTSLVVSSTSTLTLVNTAGLTVSATANNTVNGIIAGAGSGGLVKTGTGTLTLTAASGNNTLNTYSGGITINTASSGAINVTGLANITSTAIAQNTQSVTFSSTAPTNGTYRLLPGALTVGTESFSHNADGSKIVTFDYPTSTVTVASSTLPTITGATTTAAFTTTYGAVSAAQSFPVSGANLTADLVVTATAPYRVSTDGTTFGSSVTFTQTAGFASGTLFIRLGNISVNAGSYNSQNIVLSSTGATSVNIVTPASGNTVSPRAITISGPTFTKQIGSTIATGAGSTFFTITTGALQNSETIGSITLDSTGAAAGATAGTYPTVPSLATGGTFNAANYTITYTNGTLTVAAQSTGDYRSVANGNWSALTTWERWNGTAWATPTSAVTEGWPGENAVTSRVFISDNNTVTADVSISGANRPTRLEFLPNANNAVLNINTGVSLGINGNVVIASIGPGTGDAILNVGSGSLPIQGLLRLNDTPGPDNDCELRIGTGSVSVSGTDARMLGAADENLIIFDGAGTLSTLGATTVALAGAGTFTAGAGTVIFNGAAQTVGSYAFNNVTLSGSGIKTVSTGATIAGALSIATGCSASLGAATNYTIDSLVLGGVGRVAGTWGHTNSSPTNINDTFFAATTGYLTVGKSAPDVTPTIGTYVYNGTAQGPNTATNTGTGTSYTFTYRGVAPTVYSASAAPPTNAGTYSVTATVAADGSFAAISSAATPFEITTAALTITANNATKIIGTTYTVGAGSTAFTSSGLQGSETIGSITIASTGAVSTAALGSYPIVPSAATGGTFTASNYTITYNVTTPGLLTVNPNTGDYRTKASGDWTTLATWERWNGTTWVEPTVGEGYPTQNAAVLRLDILDSHNITCGIGTGSNYVARLTITAGANNTSLTFTSSLYFQLQGNAPIVLSSTGAGNALLDVGNASIYSFNQLQMGIPSSTGICKVIINNGSLNLAGNLTMSGSAAQNIIQFDGSGTLTISGSTSGAGSTISGGTIIAGTGTVQYTTYNATQTIGAYTFNNLYLSSTSTFTKTLNASTIINGNLTIANAAVASLAAGVNYTVDSLILGTTGSASGTWGSTTSSASNPNNTYFAATTGYLTVGKSAPDVTPTIGTYVYNGTAQGPNTATNTGTGTSYTFSYRNSGGTSYGPTATAPTNAGNYTVTVTVAADGSFAARSSAATAFTIATAALTITANNATKIIGATFTTGAGSTAFTPIGLQNSETIGSVTIASSGAVSTAALGTYTITPSAAVGGTFVISNYTITYATGTLTVNPNGGDYRTKASGDWTTLATWERWNGTAWVEPTVGEGYPSQNTFPTRVNILNSHNVTCGIGVTGTNRPRRIEIAAGANNTSLTFTSSNYFEISGNLVLTATGAGSAFVNVNAAYLGVTDSVSLADTPSSATDCEVVITTGALYVFDGNLVMNGAADENAIRLGSGYLKCLGNMTGGTIVSGTGTVEYAGDAQTVGAYNFYNLILSGTLTKTLNAATVIAENLTISGTAIASLNAGTTYTVNSLIYGTAGQPQGTYGSTTSAATNKNDTYFASTGILDVTLSAPDISVTLGTYIYTGLPQGPNTATNTGSGTNYTFSYRSNGGTVYPVSPTPPTNAGNYFVTVTLAADGSYASRRLVDTAFSISRRALTVTANNGTKEFGTTYTTGSGSTLFTPIGLQNSETIGSVTIASTGAVSTAALGTYPIVASAATGGTFTASNYTITYADGTLTVVQNTGDYRSKSSGDWTTLTTWERWNGTAWVEPTGPQGYPCQNAAPFRVDILNGHAVTCGIGVTGTNRLTRLEIAADANDTSLTFTSSAYFEVIGNIVVTATGAGNALLDVGNSTLVSAGGFLRMNNVVSPAPATSKVIINNGTLTSSGANLQMIGDAAKTIIEFTGAGLLRTAGATANALVGGSIIPGTGTVEFMGAAQTVGIYNFNNLSLSGSGVKTINALTTIAGNVRIAGTAVASLNAGTTYNVDTLTLDCDGTVNGTWGSTTSSATNTNNTYFADTTGMLNVATNSTVNPLAVIAVVQPTCTTSTGTVTVTVQIITDTYSFDNGLTYQTSNVKSGLAVGSYNVIIKHRSGCLSPVTVATLSSPTKTWNGSANSDWNNAANWTPSGVPVATNCIVVPDVTNDLIINGTNYTAQLYSLTVANGVTVTVEPTNSLIVTDFITVNTGGTLTIQNNANLVQVNNATNTGNIIYQRTPPTQAIESDYIYWSSPVSGMTLEGISPGDYAGGFFYSFNSTTDNWTDIPINTTMVPGLGYIMRGQKTHNDPFTINATFTGVPNNGPVNAPTGLTGNSVLLGNPYPSAIDADKFLADNSTKIEGTLYFWTHRTPRIGNEYTVDDYASYNGTGSVAVSGGTAPTGKIASCQGFFTTSLGAGDATFTNDMRLVGGIPLDNTNFYKTKNQNSVASIERNRVWLNLTNTKGIFKQLLVGYVTDATNEYDSRFDGKSFDGNEYVDFYSINQNKNLTIQGRALPFDENDAVPLGFRSKISGDFSINIHKVDGALTNQDIVIEDKLTNTFVNLKNGSFSFSTAAGTFNDRFVLRYIDKTLSTNDVQLKSNKVLVSIKNKQIKINAFSENIDKVTIYDLLGRQIYQKTKVSSNELILSNFVSSNQTLLVKTTLQNGSIVTEKVIY